MKQIIPLYSRKKVNNAWKILINNDATKEDRKEALFVLNNRRASYNYPINTFQSNIRKKIKSLRYVSVVVERLKRTNSIIEKLKRNNSMLLSRMQDIWWLRVILRDINYIEELRNSIVSSKFDHKLHREDDYIKSPKSSGYRWWHLIYKYKNKYDKGSYYNGLLIEIQIRTELQHVWATAVETVWIMLNSHLKSSIWPELRLDFFTIVSSLFAIKEWCNILDEHKKFSVSELKEKLKQRIKKLDVVDTMTAYSSAIKIIDEDLNKKKMDYEYYLLVLDMIKKSIHIWWFKKWELSQATDMYLKEEKNFRDEKKWQVVLVSAEWLKELKKWYPNYFWDTVEFIRMLKIISD